MGEARILLIKLLKHETSKTTLSSVRPVCVTGLAGHCRQGPRPSLALYPLCLEPCLVLTLTLTSVR